MLRKFEILWFYFWGHLISRPMWWLDVGWFYPLYNKWMSKSADLDVDEWWWKSVKKEDDRETDTDR